MKQIREAANEPNSSPEKLPKAEGSRGDIVVTGRGSNFDLCKNIFYAYYSVVLNSQYVYDVFILHDE